MVGFTMFYLVQKKHPLKTNSKFTENRPSPKRKQPSSNHGGIEISHDTQLGTGHPGWSMFPTWFYWCQGRSTPIISI